MSDIIQFWFWIWGGMLTLINTYWILAVFLLLKIFTYIVNLINNTKSQ